MFNNGKIDPLVPENMEKNQELLLNPKRRNSSDDSFGASGSNNSSPQNDKKAASHVKSKCRKTSIDRMITDNDQALDLSRHKTCDSSDRFLSNNNDLEIINYNSAKKISAPKCKHANERTQRMGIYNKFLINESPHFMNQTQQGVENFGRKSHSTRQENTVSDTNISKFLKNENPEVKIPASGKSKEEKMRYGNDISGIPDESGTETIYCHICENGINKHAIFHEGKKIFKCCFCKYESNHKHNFMRHIKRHGSEPFFCKICGDVFKEKGSHDTELTCNVCKETFPCKTFLLEHSITHPEFCVICWKGTDDHISEYDGGMCYKCCKCEKKTSKQKFMWEHFYCHFEERAYKCDKCGKRCRFRNSLIKHRRRKICKKFQYDYFWEKLFLLNIYIIFRRRQWRSENEYNAVI